MHSKLSLAKHWLKKLSIGRKAVLAIAFSLIIRHSIASTAPADALAAWDKNIQSTKEELTRPSGNRHSCLPITSQKDRSNNSKLDHSSALPIVSGDMIVVPSGLIHHWTGAIFIPNARDFDLVAVLQDYDSYADLYGPAVIGSNLLRRNQQEFIYQLKFVQKEFGIKVGLLGKFRTTYYRSSESAGYSVTDAMQLVELQNPGSPAEKPIPSNASHGYIQRTFSIVRYQQYETGVSVEVESLTLSRGVPGTVRWLIAPMIQRFSRQTMTVTLQRLQDRVQAAHSFASASKR